VVKVGVLIAGEELLHEGCLGLVLIKMLQQIKNYVDARSSVMCLKRKLFPHE
jgi:hypothetical protein